MTLHKNRLKIFINVFDLIFFFQLQGSSVDEEEDQEIDPESQSPEGQNNHQSQKDGQNLDDSGQASGTGMSRFQKDCLHLLTFPIYFDG